MTGPMPERILQVGLGFWASKALLTAVELRLFTELARGPVDAETLRTRLKLHGRSARDFFDALVALGFLERDGTIPERTGQRSVSRPRETVLSRRLSRDVQRPALSVLGTTDRGAAHRGCRRTKPQSAAVISSARFTPTRCVCEGFLSAMTGLSRGANLAIASKFPWIVPHVRRHRHRPRRISPCKSRCAHPHLSGSGFDLPPSQPVFTRYVSAHGVAHRLRFHPGSFLSRPPARRGRLHHGSHPPRLVRST